MRAHTATVEWNWIPTSFNRIKRLCDKGEKKAHNTHKLIIICSATRHFFYRPHFFPPSDCQSRTIRTKRPEKPTIIRKYDIGFECSFNRFHSHSPHKKQQKRRRKRHTHSQRYQHIPISSCVSVETFTHINTPTIWIPTFFSLDVILFFGICP